MKNHFIGKRIMQKKVISSLGIMLLVLFMVNFGCSTTASLIKKVKPDQVHLKKRVIVLPPIDHSGLPSGEAVQVSSNLVEILNSSENLLMFQPPESLQLPEVVKKPQFGVAYYDPQLIETVKEANMNAVLAVYMPPIEITEGRKGIWPFRYDAHICKITIIVNVLDTVNGCLYLTDLDAGQAFFASKEVEGVSQEDLFIQTVEEAMPDILKRHARDVEVTLAKESWAGRIIEMRRDQLVINGGEDVGVLPDHLFAVYKQGESILCKTGRTVDLLGEKVGEIRVVSVMERHSLAIPLNGGPFNGGETIILIQEG